MNNRGELLRFERVKDEHRLGRDRTWADLAIPDKGWEVISGQHVVLRREGQRYRIHDGNGKGKPNTNGLFIHHTRIKGQSGLRLEDNAQLQIGQNPQNMILTDYVVRSKAAVTSNKPGKSRIDFNKGQIAAPHTLQDGDIIQVGPFTLLFRGGLLEIFSNTPKAKKPSLTTFPWRLNPVSSWLLSAAAALENPL